jgi:hypothetical protein
MNVVLNNSNATRPSRIAVIVIEPNKVRQMSLQDGRNDEDERGFSYLGLSNNPGNVLPDNPVRHPRKSKASPNPSEAIEKSPDGYIEQTKVYVGN